MTPGHQRLPKDVPLWLEGPVPGARSSMSGWWGQTGGCWGQLSAVQLEEDSR